ncbi:hypothetical protein K1719_010007 [Acacia pycnantha]|nr:hypothetical protein K1719_010007 [Acacia pycnantha]
MSSKTAQHMRWHEDDKNQDGKLRHPRDAEAWKAFDSVFPGVGRVVESQVIQFSSVTTKDGISPGANLLFAMEALVSGPNNKQSLLDADIMATLGKFELSEDKTLGVWNLCGNLWLYPWAPLDCILSVASFEKQSIEVQECKHSRGSFVALGALLQHCWCG